MHCRKGPSLIREALYGNSALSHDEFVAKIQSVLRSLNATRKDIPSMYVLDFSSPRMSVDRTSASLYLMLFQVCRILPSRSIRVGVGIN